MKATILGTLLALSIASLPFPSAPSEAPARPRIFGIAQVRFFSSDLRAANNFYSPLLGMMPPTNCASCETRPATGFSINGLQTIALSPMPSPAPENLLAEITLATDDIAALRRYLEFHKVPFTVVDKVDTAAPGKMPLTIIDPEDRRISFIEWKKSMADMLSEFPERHALIHAGFVVHDRHAEDLFYKDLLGFHVYWRGGMQDGTDDWIDMQVPDGTDWIEYMLNVPANADQHTRGVMNHMAIGVQNIHTAYGQLVARGVHPTEQPKIGRDGKWQLNLYDPDDTRVEFMEFTPTEKPCCSPYAAPHPGSQPKSPTTPSTK